MNIISLLTAVATIPLRPIIIRMLKTADPTMVPVPTSDWAKNTPETRYHMIYIIHTLEHWTI